MPVEAVCQFWLVTGWISRLTKACAVVKPIPPRFTPVTRMVLPRMDSGNALATSKASVFASNSEWEVAVIFAQPEVFVVVYAL